MKKDEHVDYDYNEDADLRTIEEGIENLNRRLEHLQEQTTDEQDSEQDNERKILWPSFTNLNDD